MSNFQLPKPHAIDLNGNVMGGAKLYFYITATTTPKDTYTTKALATANANPVVADAAGRFGEIWLNDDVAYKVVLKDSADVTIYTVDPVYALAIDAQSVLSQIEQLGSNPLIYGALGDGVANEVAAVQSAITNATGTIDLLGMTFRCDSTLTIGAGKRFINGTLDFSSCTATPCIDVTGGSLGSGVALTANVDAGDKQLTVSSSSTFPPGAYVLLSTSAAYFSGFTGGEIARVKTQDSGTQITLESRLRLPYTTASTATVKLITLTSRTTFQDLRIIANQATAQTAIRAQYSDRFTMNNVCVDGVSNIGLQLVTSVNAKVKNCSFRDINVASTGDAIQVTTACANIDVGDCEFYDTKTGVSVTGTAGVSRDVRVHDCQMDGIRSFGVYLDASASQNLVSDNVINLGHTSTSFGVLSYGDDNRIQGNIIRNPSQDGIYCEPRRTGSVTRSGTGAPASKADVNAVYCVGNQIEYPNNYGISVSTASSTIGLVDVLGNTVTGAGSNGILVLTSNSLSLANVRCDKNIVTSPTSHAVEISLAAGTTLEGFSMCGNVVSGLTGVLVGVYVNAVDADSSRSGVLNGNVVTGGIGIGLTNCRSVVANGNLSNDSTDSGMLLSGVSGASLSGNFIYSPVVHGIFVSNCSATVLSDNSVKSAGTHGVYVLGGSGVSVSGNSIDAPGSTGVHAEYTGSATKKGLVVSNNVILAPASRGIFVGSTGGGEYVGVTVAGNEVSEAGGDGILFLTSTASSDITHFTVTGNQVRQSSQDGIEFNSGTGTLISRGVISGNCVDLPDAGAGACILFSGGNAIQFLRCFVSGNLTCDGAYGIRDSTGSASNTIHVGGNVLTSHTGGQYITGLVTGSYGGDSLITATTADAGDAADANTKNLANIYT